jgi:SAM-dependent methyltransferase
VWAREDGAWRLSLWQVERIPTAREEWNEVYRLDLGFNRKPNQLLVDVTKDVKPGEALDVATGQGRNALYLAEKGWKVTGVDISDEGLRIAKKSADDRKLPLETVEADTSTWDFGKDRWDLVTSIYAGADPKDIERIKTALRPGGMIVVEVFHKDGTTNTRSSGFETGQLAKLCAGYRIIRDEVVLDQADWGGANKIKLVRFAATKPR